MENKEHVKKRYDTKKKLGYKTFKVQESPEILAALKRYYNQLKQTNKMKLNEKEIEELQKIRNEVQTLLFAFGQNEVARQQVEADKLAIQNAYVAAQKKESDFMQVLLKEYGPGQLSLGDYSFTPEPKTEETSNTNEQI
jgi:hypothetical protein